MGVVKTSVWQVCCSSVVDVTKHFLIFIKSESTKLMIKKCFKLGIRQCPFYALLILEKSRNFDRKTILTSTNKIFISKKFLLKLQTKLCSI